MLAVSGAHKRFGDLDAVRDVTFTARAREICAVIGENGAGKSTLLKLAAGLLVPTSGEVEVGGSPLFPPSPDRATQLGVGLVHQHFMLIEAFDALDNIALGHEPTVRGLVDKASVRTRVEALMEETGLRVPTDVAVERLAVGERQRIEILKVLFRGAKVLLLDEPTAVLSPPEAEKLYGVLRRLADEGRVVVVVTHRLDEVVRFADQAVVLRRGKQVGSFAKDELDPDRLTGAIMGDQSADEVPRPKLDDVAEVRLEVRDLTVRGERGQLALSGCTFDVKKGEVLGVAGVEGNGQAELLEVLAGLREIESGTLRLDAKDLAALSMKERRGLLATVFEDRHRQGLMLPATVSDNLVLGELGEHASEADVVARRIERFRVHPPDGGRAVAHLSGGNQQKVVVARALDRIAHVAKGRGALVLAQPTRGVDVGAASVIHRSIAESAAAGFAILLISADLHELRLLSHRIAVLAKGKIAHVFKPSASDQEIGAAMLGREVA